MRRRAPSSSSKKATSPPTKRTRRGKSDEMERPADSFPFEELIDDVKKLIVERHMTLFDSIVFGQTCKKWHQICFERFEIEVERKGQEELDRIVGLESEMYWNGLPGAPYYSLLLATGIGELGSSSLRKYYFDDDKKPNSFFMFAMSSDWGEMASSAIRNAQFDFFFSIAKYVPPRKSKLGKESSGAFSRIENGSMDSIFEVQSFALALGGLSDFSVVKSFKDKYNLPTYEICASAAKNGVVETIDELFDDLFNNDEEIDKYSTFFSLYSSAAENGHIGVVSKLLERFEIRFENGKNNLADVFEGSDVFYNPKCIPVKGKIIPFLEYLEKGVDVNSPMIVSAVLFRGDWDALEYLESRFSVVTQAMSSIDLTLELKDIAFRRNYALMVKIFDKYSPKNIDMVKFFERVVSPYDVDSALEIVNLQEIEWIPSNLKSDMESFELIEIIKYLISKGFKPPAGLLADRKPQGGMGIAAPFRSPDFNFEEFMSNWIILLDYLFENGVDYHEDFIDDLVDRYGSDEIIALKEKYEARNLAAKPALTRKSPKGALKGRK